MESKCKKYGAVLRVFVSVVCLRILNLQSVYVFPRYLTINLLTYLCEFHNESVSCQFSEVCDTSD